MKINVRYIRKFFAASLAGLFACTVLIPGTPTYAAPRHRPPRPVVVRHHHHVSPLLPLGFALLTIAGLEYYYHQGRYYRHIENQYVLTPPPVGSVILELPSGHVGFWANGIQYYYYGNVYYKRVPKGYVVVDPPYDSSSKPPVVHQSVVPTTNEVKVLPPMLNVRSGPGTDHEVIFQVPQGMILEIHGDATEWLFVKLPSGEFGWVMKKFTVSESVPKFVPAEG